MLEKLTKFSLEELYIGAILIFAAISLKTIIHPPSRGVYNFFVSLFAGLILGSFTLFILEQQFQVQFWTAALFAMLVAMLADRFFLKFLSDGSDNFVEWVILLIKNNTQKIIDVLINKIK